MAIDAGSWIIVTTTLIIYLVFLFYDTFRREENYGNLAYIAAVIPCNYLWYLLTRSTDPDLILYRGFGVTGAWTVLIGMWFIAMLRDIILVKTKKKEFDSVVLYLIIGILIQIILSSILPFTVGDMTADYGSNEYGTYLLWGFIFLPNIFDAGIAFATALIFKILITLLLLGVIIPLVLDLRGEPVNMWVLIVITAIFSLPIMLISFLWIGIPFFWALSLLFLVLFFVVLLMLTKGAQKN
jgi:hypothetical protein